MIEPKLFQTHVHSDADGAGLPTKAVFTIDQATAQRIVRLSTLVKENSLFKTELFDSRVEYLSGTPEAGDDDIAGNDDRDGFWTEAETLNVTEAEFWFSAYLRHSETEFFTERQRIADLAKHFGLSVLDNKSSVPVKYWDCYNSPENTVDTHFIDLDDQRRRNGQMYVDVGLKDGGLDAIFPLTIEVNTDPLNGLDHVPCVHVHFNNDHLAFSVFKLADKLLLRPETDVTIEPTPRVLGKRTELFYSVCK